MWILGCVALKRAAAAVIALPSVSTYPCHSTMLARPPLEDPEPPPQLAARESTATSAVTRNSRRLMREPPIVTGCGGWRDQSRGRGQDRPRAAGTAPAS